MRDLKPKSYWEYKEKPRRNVGWKSPIGHEQPEQFILRNLSCPSYDLPLVIIFPPRTNDRIYFLSGR